MKIIKILKLGIIKKKKKKAKKKKKDCAVSYNLYPIYKFSSFPSSSFVFLPLYISFKAVSNSK